MNTNITYHHDGEATISKKKKKEIDSLVVSIAPEWFFNGTNHMNYDVYNYTNPYFLDPVWCCTMTWVIGKQCWWGTGCILAEPDQGTKAYLVLGDASVWGSRDKTAILCE